MLLRNDPDFLHVLEGLVVLLHLDEAIGDESQDSSTAIVRLFENVFGHLVGFHEKL